MSTPRIPGDAVMTAPTGSSDTPLAAPVPAPAPPRFDVAAIMGAMYGNGITALKGALSRDWVERMREDIDVLFARALTRPGGAVGRGPKRYYVEIHPKELRGFLDLVTHPWVVTVCEAVLGPDYRFVEIGFDVPNPGALHQPWHRDFPAPSETVTGRRLNSLAFNVTGVDTFEDMGPFEIAPGTQWDDPTGFEHGMFPPKALYPRYESLAPPRTTTQRSPPICGVTWRAGWWTASSQSCRRTPSKG